MRSRIYSTFFVVAFLILSSVNLLNAQKPVSNSNKDLPGAKKSHPTFNVTNANENSPSVIYLNAARIDALSVERQSARRAVSAFSGKQMHIIKFRDAIQPEWYKLMTDAGVEVVDYIPNYAYVVFGDYTSISHLQDLAGKEQSPIVWDGEYLPDYRISPDVYGLTANGGIDKNVIAHNRFMVQLYSNAETNTATIGLLNSIKIIGTPVYQQGISHYIDIVVSLTPDALRRISERPDVISISTYIEPIKNDERQTMIMAGLITGNVPTPGNYLTWLAGKGFTQAQFDASGFVVNVSDDGLDNGSVAGVVQTTSHFALYKNGDPTQPSRVAFINKQGTATDNDTRGIGGHGNLNNHIVAGYVPDGLIGNSNHADASGFRYGMGVAPFVKLGSSIVFKATGPYTNPNFTTLESQSYQGGGRISSNSWGAPVGGVYNADAQAYDFLVRDAQPASSPFPTAGNQEMVIVFAAGNDGPNASSVGAPGTGKNVITVGASENVNAFPGGTNACGWPNSVADNLFEMATFSSRGPCTDGRIKPDIVAPGTHVTGGVYQLSPLNPIAGPGIVNPSFTGASSCGFAPPTQQWTVNSTGTSHSTPAVAGFAALIRQHFINNGLAPASPAMTKAVICVGGRYMTGAGANDNLYSNNQGMGLTNMGFSLDAVSSANKILRDQVPADMFTASGQSFIRTGVVANNALPLRVTLAYTDAPGATSGNAFVNNLDLEVTVNGITYLGNVFTGANSVTGGTADAKDNMESVFLPAGVSGPVSIKVKATNIAGDGVPNVGGALDQDFALIVTNVTEAVTPIISAAGSTLGSESCTPANNVIDVGETVTVSFCAQNIGTGNATNLVGTLLATGGVSSPSAAQNYGAMAAGGPAVCRNFTFTANHTCGAPITASIQFQDGATNLGVVTYTLSTASTPGAPVVYTSTSTPVNIPDNDPVGVDIPVTVPATGSIADVNVKFRLNHTFDGDLIIKLTSPDNTTVTLVNSRGSSGDNFGTGTNDCTGTPTVIDDAAATSISTGVAPFAGTFKPETPLNVFNGKAANGVWKLNVSDNAALDVGTVGCFQLEISTSVCSGCTPAVPVTVTATAGNVGPTDYNTVKLAFDAINAGTHQGAVTVKINSNTTETAQAVLNRNGVGSAAYTSVNIRPNSDGVTVTGAFTSAIIKLNNAENVTIDGDNPNTSGTNRNLSIINTFATTPSIVWIGGSLGNVANNVVLKNCILQNGTSTASGVVVSDGTTLGTAGYFTNVTIQNNSISNSYIANYNNAVPAAGNGNGLLLTGNDLNTSGATQNRLVGIYVQGVDGATVSNNNIGNMVNTADAANVSSIWLATGTINTTLSGNTISTMSTTSGAPRGIAISSGVPSANIIVRGNTISGLTSAGTGTTTGIFLFAATSGVTVQNNKISNIRNTQASGFGANGIQLASTSTTAATTVYNNFISDVTGLGFNGVGVGDNGYGMVISAGGGYNVYYNTISMNTNQTVATGQPAALNVTSGVTTANSLDIRNNIFANTETIGNQRYSVISGASSSVYQNINNNDYYFTGSNLGIIGGTNRANLAAWQTGTGKDANSVSTAPVFVSATDLHLVATVINCGVNAKGTPIAGITTDIDADTRDAATPDIGADEINVNCNPCILTCPANITAPATTGLCGAVVNYPPPTSSGGCGTITSTPASGSFFPVGTTTINVSSASGSTCSFTITVTDNQLPTITCPASISRNADAGVCTASVAVPNATTADNCSVAKLTWVMTGATPGTSPATGINNIGTMTFNNGVTNVTYTVTDASNNSATCSFTVTVVDTQNPVTTCPGNMTATTPIGSCTASVVTPNPTVTDNCGVTVLTWALTGATIGTSPATGINNLGTRAFNIGTTTVTYITKDAANNSSTCSYTVTVADGQLPVISVQPVNRTVCEGTTATFTVTATNVVTYQWQFWNGTAWVNTGTNSSSLPFTAVNVSQNTNTYRVILNGLCTTITSGTATLFVNKLPIVTLTASRIPILLPGESVNITASTIPGGGSFVWFKNGVVIPGVSGPALTGLTVDDIGTYKTTYTDPNGCITTSGEIAVSGAPSGNLYVFPNPNFGQFSIRFNNTVGDPATVTVFDSKGARVFQRQLVTTTAYTKLDVDLGPTSSSGVYIVEVRNSAGKLVGAKRVIVRHQ